MSFNFITNPETGKKISILSQKGDAILFRYIQELEKKGGSYKHRCITCGSGLQYGGGNTEPSQVQEDDDNKSVPSLGEEYIDNNIVWEEAPTTYREISEQLQNSFSDSDSGS